jgi:predicted RNA methylase
MPTQTLVSPRLGNTRVTGKEQYYTPEALANSLMNQVEEALGALAGRTILEPAGGTGAFIEAAKAAGAKEILSFDIEPLHPQVQPGSFLDQQIEQSDLITISNPPFGRNNALSIPFFNHAAKVSEAICFIVPRSWRKWSVTNRLDLTFEKISDFDLDIDYVDSKGHPISSKKRLATCFQIWKRASVPRTRIRVKDLRVIQKVSASDADVSLTIFGYGCGKLKTEFEQKPNTTQLFLKLIHPKALDALQAVDYSRFYKNTAYTEALSLQEINYLLNEEIFGDPMIERY